MRANALMTMIAGALFTSWIAASVAPAKAQSGQAEPVPAVGANGRERAAPDSISGIPLPATGTSVSKFAAEMLSAGDFGPGVVEPTDVNVEYEVLLNLVSEDDLTTASRLGIVAPALGERAYRVPKSVFDELDELGFAVQLLGGSTIFGYKPQSDQQPPG